MEVYIATVFAKLGHEEDVTNFYRDLEPSYAEAKGFHGRQILRARPGTMLEAVKKVVTPEEIARHPEPPGPPGVHFVIIEQWDSVDDRIAFSRSLDSNRQKALFPHLLPEHTHEFYSDVTPD